MDGFPVFVVVVLFVVAVFVGHYMLMSKNRCPKCRSFPVPEDATKCPYCTADLPEGWQEK
jgi:hypothetical protein